MSTHRVLPISPDILGFAEIIAPQGEIDGKPKPSEPHLYQTYRMKRLSTPWSVCLTRAEQLSDCRLGKGILLDPACGSGSQLFAYCSGLERAGLGIELDADSAVLSAANGQIVADSGSNSEWTSESFVLVGDGTDATAALAEIGLSGRAVAVMHVDPARPLDTQNHSLDEMEPPISTLLNRWAEHFVIGSRGPAIIIDLSPRLLETQQREIEVLLLSYWPDSPITWEWVSTGRGRIDRLTIWFGAAAESATPARMLRLLSDGSVVSFAGRATEVKRTTSATPSTGDWLTIVDSALLASGLQGQWLREALPAESTRHWVRISGRRPMLLSSEPLQMEKSLVGAFVSSTGQVISRLKVEPTVENIPPILVSANAAYLSRLTLRCKMEPSAQPKIQGKLDHGLKDYPRGKPGFLADVETNGGHAWFICKEP
ncbi:MAG: hypothetical protein CXT67_07270 [Methanobacteriota archaeon]|jgi:hypothetical protein|nr:MAG: hypothetical protein CXT67_07270 [Euryarchaeota archaeon]HIG19789.1 hypothetical protein [Candidatus Poseidoniales archaeon]